MAVDLTAPEGVRDALRRGLRLHEAGRSGDGLKPETVAWARRLADGEAASEQKVREMSAWHKRHKASKSPGWDEPGKEKPGFVAYLLWGGEPGEAWADRKVAEMDRAKTARAHSIWFATPRAFSGGGHDDRAVGYVVSDGIAQMWLSGPVSMHRRADGASWEDVRATLAQVKADPAARALVIHISSGGGAVAGMQAAAYDLRDLGKPSLAFIDPMGESAVFYFALAATHTWAAPMAFVGALGVYVEVDNTPIAPAIVSQITPEKNLPPDDPRAVESTAAAVEALARVMLTDVAEWAGLPDAAAAAAFYGNGRDLVAVDALALGMLDGVAVRPPLHLFNPAGPPPAHTGGDPMPGVARAEAAAAEEPEIMAEGEALAEEVETEEVEMTPEEKAARIKELEDELRMLKGESMPEEPPGPAALAFADRLVTEKAINPAERIQRAQAFQRDPAKALREAPKAGAAYHRPTGEGVKPKNAGNELGANPDKRTIERHLFAKASAAGTDYMTARADLLKVRPDLKKTLEAR